MPAAVYQCNRGLFEVALRSFLANGPRRSLDLWYRTPGDAYVPAGELRNGPCAPPLYRSVNGARETTCPLPCHATDGGFVPAAAWFQTLYAVGPGNAAPAAQVLPSEIPISIGQPVPDNFHGTPSSSVRPWPPPYFTDLRVDHIELVTGADRRINAIGRELGSSQHAFWKFVNAANDLSQPEPIAVDRSGALPDVFLLFYGLVNFYDDAAIDHGGIDSDPRWLDFASYSDLSAFKTCDFTSDPLLFRLSAVPARYYFTKDPVPRMARRGDYPHDGMSVPERGLKDVLAIDLVFEPILVAGRTSLSNPLGSGAWNTDPLNQQVMNWLIDYNSATAGNYAIPRGGQRPDLPGFRYTLPIDRRVAPLTWPFNAALSLVEGPPGNIGVQVGLSTTAATSSAGWASEWSSFFQPQPAQWQWPLSPTAPDLAVYVPSQTILQTVDAALTASLSQVYHDELDLGLFSVGVDLRLRNFSRSWDANGLHLDADVQVNLAGWNTLGSAKINGAVSIDQAAGHITVDLNLSFALFGILPVPSSWFSGFATSMAVPPGWSLEILSSGHLRLACSNVERIDPYLGTIRFLEVREFAAGIQMLASLDPFPFDFSYPPQLTASPASGFHVKIGDSPDAFATFTIGNDGMFPLTLFEARIVANKLVNAILSDGSSVGLPSDFWSIGFRFHKHDAFVPLDASIAVPPSGEVTIQVTARFSALGAWDAHLSAPIAIAFFSSARTLTVVPTGQPSSINPLIGLLTTVVAVPTPKPTKLRPQRREPPRPPIIPLERGRQNIADGAKTTPLRLCSFKVWPMRFDELIDPAGKRQEVCDVVATLHNHGERTVCVRASRMATYIDKKSGRLFLDFGGSQQAGRAIASGRSLVAESIDIKPREEFILRAKVPLGALQDARGATITCKSLCCVIDVETSREKFERVAFSTSLREAKAKPNDLPPPLAPLPCGCRPH